MRFTEEYMATDAADARLEADKFLRRYPVNGYDTRVTIAPDDTFPAPYTFRVSVSRYPSCD